jgi:hypothetical protein
MTKEALIEKIEALPPEKKAEVEDFVNSLAARGASVTDHEGRKAQLRELVGAIDAGRGRLLKEKGLLDSVPLIREFRETGE